MLNVRLFVGVAWSTLAGLACSVTPVWAADYKTADEAFNAGAKLHNQRNYAAAQEPFEAALALAPDDAYRQKVYSGLIPSYRQLPQPDKMIEACEFIIAHTESFPERSNISRTLQSFLLNRGLNDTARKRYEATLDKTPDDVIGLSMMVAITSQDRKDRAQTAEYRQRLQVVERKQAGELAEKSEAIASQKTVDESYHWKEAANRWMQAEEPAKALAAAHQAVALGPDKRSDLLQHFWHRQIGEVFLGAGEFKSAVEHLQKAIETTTIQGYKDECQKKLTEAQTKSDGK